MSNYYEILGIARSAGSGDVRKAYLQLARERHPDRFSDPAEKQRAQTAFQEITAAFNTLFNERERREYDRALEQPRPTTPAGLAGEAHAHGLQKLESGPLAEAVEHFRAAVHFVPNDARYHHALGIALSRNPPSAREAAEALETAVRLAPGEVAYHLDLAELFLRQGMKIRARRVAEAALKLDPRDPRVQQVAQESGLPGSGPPPAGGGLGGLPRRKP